MNFSEALIEVKNGKKIYRSGWNGWNMHVELQVPDQHSKMKRPYLFIKLSDGDLVPWTPDQTDILAEDWRKL